VGALGEWWAFGEAQYGALAGADVVLLRLCERMIGAEAESKVLYAAVDTGSVDEEEIEVRAAELNAEIKELHYQIAAIHPATWAGVIAKAKAASAIVPRNFDGAAASESGWSGNIAWSLIEGLAGHDHTAVELWGVG
jgi:hypothetical protein